MSRRSRAREVVLQLLYQRDLCPGEDPARAQNFLSGRLGHDEELIEFARSLLLGVIEHRAELDALLAARTANWSLERMAVTDRNVLRLGAFEILHTPTPGRVVINEALELAKRYGAKSSAPFVNGLLDRLLKEFRPEPAPPSKSGTPSLTSEDSPQPQAPPKNFADESISQPPPPNHPAE